MQKVFVRSAHNYDAAEVSKVNAVTCDPEDTRTKRSFAEECDINTIVKRFGLTHEVPTTFRMPMVGDFTGVTDFQSAMQQVRAAEEAFMELPAEVRKRFGHDPQELMTFLGKEENRAEALKLGLLQPPPEKTRDVVTAVDELRAAMVPRETPPK